LQQPLLTQKDKPATNGHDTTTEGEFKPPVDIDARLAAMRFKGGGDTAINITRRDVAASMLARGIGVEEIVRILLDATKKAVADDPRCAHWRWTPEDPGHEESEEQQIWDSCVNFIAKLPEKLTDRLPDSMQAQLTKILELRRRPKVSRNAAGWHLRGYSERSEYQSGAKEEHVGEGGDGGEEHTTKAGNAKRVLKLNWFEPFDVSKHPPRAWLFGRHYQRQTVSLTAGPGGMGKSSLDLVEGISMATCRNLLGEQPEEQLRVWFRNGDDPLEETMRRVAAICQHYGIPQEELQGHLCIMSGNEFPLRVARGYTSLEIDTDLVRQISDAIGEKGIDLVIFDPLVTMHSVSEMDTGKMDAVIRLFAGIADEYDCAIEVAHHVRKPAPGAAADYDVHDIRGVQAITDAVRAARILNRMNPKDAEAAGCDEGQRLLRFRVDRAKGNYSPASAATWRQLVNVEIANGDAVGVVAPWEFPGQGAPTPEKAAADQKADEVFLHLLDKFGGRGLDVSAKVGSNYAPARFADEREAKGAKVSKTALKAAMARLLDTGQIALESTGRSDRSTPRLVIRRES
jgi:AAA domain